MRIVQKFGGTSVADVTRIQHVARMIGQERERGNQVVVVVSAMAGVTNQLINLSQAITPTPLVTAAHDVVFSTGEQVSCGLLVMALAQMGLQAEAFMGWQIPILTDDTPSNARILNIPPQVLEDRLSQGIIPVVAGYQGLSPTNHITTLGRGGSDTTAVALAAFLKADLCDIYTDVDGVYTADPRCVPRARRLREISYEEMLMMAIQGAKVLQARSVEMAMQYGVRVRVLSSFQDYDPSHATDVVSQAQLAQPVDIRGLTLSLNSVTDHPKMAQLSVVGMGVAKQERRFTQIVDALFHQGIQCQLGHMAPLHLTLTCPEAHAVDALVALHTRLGLDQV